MSDTRYPRMLFRDDGTTSRADSRDELLAKRAQGWRATLLPGETPEDIGDGPPQVDPNPPPVADDARPPAPIPGVDYEPGAADVAAPPKRGRPKKSE